LHIVTAQLRRSGRTAFSQLVAQARDTVDTAAARLVNRTSLFTKWTTTVRACLVSIFDSIETTDAQQGSSSINILAPSTETVAMAFAARTICAALAESAATVHTGFVAVLCAAVAREAHITEALVAAAIGILGALLAISASFPYHPAR
jgi:hypothetical protein